MDRPNDHSDVNLLKKLLVDGWKQILGEHPQERVYAFGLYTNECGQFMHPFLLGEDGLIEVAKKYVAAGTCIERNAADDLRWSVADSPHTAALGANVFEFDGRPDLFKLGTRAFAREVHYRLTAACTAIRELDAEGFFGTGEQREGITLYIEGGDVTREWLLKWAKQLNPKSVFNRFAKIGAETDTVGTFTEFGTKKVYETKRYAQSADRRLIAAATEYQLFVFDCVHLKQLFAEALPSRDDYCSLRDVSMAGDGQLIGVIPFGGGPTSKQFFTISGDGSVVRRIPLNELPMAIVVAPAGDWIAITDRAGMINIFKPDGELVVSRGGHKGWPRGAAVSEDGRLLATGDSTSVILWDTSDWSKIWTADMPIDGLQFDPTGRSLLGTCRYAANDGEPKSAMLLDVQTGNVIREVVSNGYRIQVARFSPDGQRIACAMRVDCEGYSGTNIAGIIELQTGNLTDRLKADFEQIRDFAFLPHRDEIAVAVFGHNRRPLVLWKAKL